MVGVVLPTTGTALAASGAGRTSSVLWAVLEMGGCRLRHRMMNSWDREALLGALSLSHQVPVLTVA